MNTIALLKKQRLYQLCFYQFIVEQIDSNVFQDYELQTQAIIVTQIEFMNFFVISEHFFKKISY